MKQTKRRSLRMKRSNKTLMIERKPMRTLLKKPRRRSKLNRLHLKHILLVLELRLRKPLMKLTIHPNNKIQSSLKIDQLINQISVKSKKPLRPKKKPMQQKPRKRRPIKKPLTIRKPPQLKKIMMPNQKKSMNNQKKLIMQPRKSQT